MTVEHLLLTYLLVGGLGAVFVYILLLEQIREKLTIRKTEKEYDFFKTFYMATIFSVMLLGFLHLAK